MEAYRKHIEEGLSEASIALVLTESVPERIEKGLYRYFLRFPTHTLTIDELVKILAQNLVKTLEPIEMRCHHTHLHITIDLEEGTSSAMLFTPI